jgi:hypothetical protein
VRSRRPLCTLTPSPGLTEVAGFNADVLAPARVKRTAPPVTAAAARLRVLNNRARHNQTSSRTRASSMPASYRLHFCAAPVTNKAFIGGGLAMTGRILTLAAALMLTACTTTFEPQAVQAGTGRFAAMGAVPQTAIKVREKYDVDATKQLAFVRTNIGELEKYDSYFEASLRAIGYFGKVMRKSEFERYLIQNDKLGTVSSLDGFAGLSQASKNFGRFLVVDFSIQPDIGYEVGLRMSVVDPATAKEVLKVEHGITNWGGLDGTLFQPMFNVLIDWIEENSTTFRKSTVTPAAKPAS